VAYFSTTLATHNQRQKQQQNKKLSRCLQCTGGASSLNPAVLDEWIIFQATGMWAGLQGWDEQWVRWNIMRRYRIKNKLLGCVCRWSLQLTCCISWTPHQRFNSPYKCMANLILRHILDRQILVDQQNFVLCQVSSWSDTSWNGISWSVISREI